MTADEFRNRVERKIHFIISTFVAFTSLAALFTGSINTIPSGSLCQIASIPAGCRNNPNYECERGHKLPTVAQEDYLKQIGTRLIVTIEDHPTNLRRKIFLRNSKSKQGAESSLLFKFVPLLAIFRNRQPGETDSMYISRIRVAEMVTQAFLYALSFFATFVFSWVASAYYLAGGSPPLWTLYPFAWLYSSGGFLNILVFTRPKVKILRMRYSDLSWFRAFYLVIKEGGEVPDLEDESNEENQRNDSESHSNQGDGNLQHSSFEFLHANNDDSTRFNGENGFKSNRLEAIREDEEDDDSELNAQKETEYSEEFKKKLEYYSRLRARN